MPMKETLASKCIRIILASALVAAIVGISSIGTYWFMMHKQPSEDPEKVAVVEAVENITESKKAQKGASVDTIDYSVVAESIKQQVSDAISDPYSNKRLVERVGKTLMYLLESEYSYLLSNGAFNDSKFTVAVTEYPLDDNRCIKRILYTIKSNEDGNQFEANRYFLQYVGTTSFFSDIQYGGYGEQDFQVFDNGDGCFAFLLIKGYEYKSFSPNTEYSNYSATVFIPDDTEFSEESVSIPLKVASNLSLRLVQQYDSQYKSIIAVAPYAYDNPKCIFNSSNMTFELPEAERESEPIDYNFPGLLLGLSDSYGNMRTLYIRKENGRICADDYTDQIVFTRNGLLYSITHHVLYEEFFDEGTEGYEGYVAGTTDVKKLVCSPYGTQTPTGFEVIYDADNYWQFRKSIDIPLFVGEDYVCYIQRYSITGGGSFYGSHAGIRFDRLDDLSRFSFGDEPIPDFPETTLADIIFGDNAKDYYQSDVQTYGGAVSPYVDFKQLSVMRNRGKWSLMLPVMGESYHPGNDSFYIWIDDFAAFSNEVPDFLAHNYGAPQANNLWDYWDAKDLFSFPGSNAYLAQYDYMIHVGFHDEGDYSRETFDLAIPVGIDEYIVSISFANVDGDMQEAWSNELSKAR